MNNEGQNIIAASQDKVFEVSNSNEASHAVNELIKKAINKSFDAKSLAATSSNRFYLVDLGCSVGPNTFFNMQTILEAIQNKLTVTAGAVIGADKLEFQVFFNDHVSNDFNTLFSSLPPEKQYFAAGVPGSFCGQLFPSSSIHFAYSSYSLPWLTKVPEKLLANSSAWSGTKISSIGASREASMAYAAQFEKDMENFLNARANEIVRGRMMAIITPGIPDGVDPSTLLEGIMFSFLESSLVDMVNEGILNESQVYSFNKPTYCPSPMEMASHVKKNGCFSIESMEIIKPISKNHDMNSARSLILHGRAAFEGVFTKHFGSGIVDEIFERTLIKVQNCHCAYNQPTRESQNCSSFLSSSDLERKFRKCSIRLCHNNSCSFHIHLLEK